MLQFEILYYQRRMLWIFGLYRLYNNKIERVFLEVQKMLTMAFLVGINVFLFISVFKNRHDLVAVLDACHYFMVEANILLKLCIYLYYSPLFYELEKILNGQIFNRYSKFQQHFVTDAIRYHGIILGIFQFCSVFCALVYGVVPVLDGQNLAIEVYLPIDVVRHRPLLYFYEAYVFVMTAACNSSLDAITAGLMTITAAQVDILKDNLRRAADRDPNESFEMQEIRIYKRLGLCVAHQNAILEFSKITQKIFTNVVFVQILFSVMGICATEFKFLTIPVKSGTFVSVVIFLMVEVVQIGLYNLFGENMLTKSSEIGQSCYFSEWYNCGTANKKIFFIIMERAKNPITFTANGLFVLSLNTLLMVLKNAYSYFAVLQHLLQE